MSQLRQVYLYGALSDYSPGPIELAVNDMLDLIAALKSWFPDFKLFLQEHPEFVIMLTDENKANPHPVLTETFRDPFGDAKEIHLFPAASGADPVTAAWAAFVAIVGTTAAGIIVNIAVSIVLSAVMMMLAPKPKLGNSESPDAQPSFLYNGPENVQEAGYQEPVIYGTHMTGSVVVSAARTIEQLLQNPTPGSVIPPTSGSHPPAPPTGDQWDGGGDGDGDGDGN